MHQQVGGHCGLSLVTGHQPIACNQIKYGTMVHRERFERSTLRFSYPQLSLWAGLSLYHIRYLT